MPRIKPDIGKNQMCQTQEMHCSNCGRFLAMQAIILGVVSIKCSNCGIFNTIDISPERGVEYKSREGHKVHLRIERPQSLAMGE